MSTPPPPDRPTEVIPPTGPVEPLQPVAAAVPVREVPLADAYQVSALADSLRSLRSAVVLVGIISLAALALSVYSLIHNNDKNNSRGDAGSSSRVSTLEHRVNSLDRQLADAKSSATPDPNAADASKVDSQLAKKADASDVKTLQDEIKQLQASGAGQAGTDNSAQIKDLGTRLDKAEQDIQKLKDQQAQQSR